MNTHVDPFLRFAPSGLFLWPRPGMKRQDMTNQIWIVTYHSGHLNFYNLVKKKFSYIFVKFPLLPPQLDLLLFRM